MNKHFSRKLWLGLAALVCGLSALSVRAQETPAIPLVLSVQADKDNYLPGEAVRLTVSLANQGDAVRKVNRPDPASGGLNLYLAFGEQPFQRYIAPDFNSRGALGLSVALEAGQTLTAQTVMLCHRLRPTAHLREMYARPLRDAELNDHFALNRGGQYRLKAVYFDRVSQTSIESAPLEINVREPLGFDWQFWESVKGDAAAAWFLHTGNSKQPADTLEAEQFVGKMELLLSSYRESTYAERLQTGLAKHTAQRESLRRLKNTP